MHSQARRRCVARLGERVRIRVGNLTMTNHPIHLHGHEFVVTGTDGGWTSPASRWPEVTTDIAVGQMRAIEFTAAAPGDWAFHCHKSHHTMNAMSHAVPNSIGVEQSDLAPQIAALVPGYMNPEMSGMPMNMPLPANTLPMMTGAGRYGDIEMGGMFTVVKIRADIAHGDYRDPGWYRAPAGSVAYVWEGEPPAGACAAGRHEPKHRGSLTVTASVDAHRRRRYSRCCAMSNAGPNGLPP